MVTVANATTKYYGLANDTKPTDGRNGDVFIAMDTGATYLYDEQNGQWTEYTGGGGSGESDLFIVNAVYDPDTDVATLDKTWQEMADAIADGKLVNIRIIATGSSYINYIPRLWYEPDTFDNNYYKVGILRSADPMFATDNPNGYPNDNF